MGEQDMTNFAKLLADWKGIYSHLLIAQVSIKGGSDPQLLYGRIVLLNTNLNINEFSLTTHSLEASLMLIPVDAAKVDSVISKALGGEIKVNSTSLTRLKTDNHISNYFIPPLASENMRFPTLKLSGISRHQLLSNLSVDLRQLDSELKSAEQPFDSLDELLVHCGFPNQSQMGDTTLLELVLIAPSFIMNTSLISEGRCFVKCWAATKIEKEQITLGYRIPKDAQIERGRLDGASFSWRAENDVLEGSVDFPVDSSRLLQAFLSYKGVCIYQWWIADPAKQLNQRLGIHETMDKDFLILKAMLFGDESCRAQNFEPCVATLFYLLGFSACNYGRMSKLQDGVDIIALTPQGNIAVVECTLGRLNNKDKLSKLVQRTSVLRAKIKDCGYGQSEVQPVIVSSLSRNEVSADLETAGKFKVAVICREELDNLLNRVSVPPKTEDLFKDFKKWVPSKPGTIQVDDPLV